jgi:hypothetical protein
MDYSVFFETVVLFGIEQDGFENGNVATEASAMQC